MVLSMLPCAIHSKQEKIKYSFEL